MIEQVSALLTSVQTATEIARLIRSSTTTLEKAEVKMQLAQLIDALADAKINAADIKELIAEKNELIQELEKKLKLSDEMKYEKPYYYREKDGVKDGPYCQQCHDNDQKQIRLIESTTGFWTCKTCNNSYKDDTFVRKTLRPTAHTRNPW